MLSYLLKKASFAINNRKINFENVTITNHCDMKFEINELKA